jgi:exodeoxyribonuclease V alpha subunit
VALVLADRASPIQTRELVYTGLTRASERVTWLGRADLLQGALGVRVVRGSALALRLGD